MAVTPVGSASGRRRWAAIGLASGAILVTALVLLGTGTIPLRPSERSTVSTGAANCLAAVSVRNATPLLGATFQPGAIQGIGTNASSVLIGGIGVYVKPHGYTLPVLASIAGPPPPVPATNLTALIEPYFHEGGVYLPVWNGTSWLIGGQATWSGTAWPALVGWSDGVFTNYTAVIAPFFLQGSPSPDADWGVWAVGWNGTAWLIGGNGSRGATLVSLHGGSAIDLTPRLASYSRNDWIQLLAWNGTTWIVGGYQILETYFHGTFTNYLPQAPFAGSGAYGADWNGSAWLLSGGPPASVAILEGTALRAGPPVPSNFSGAWVGEVLALTASNWDARCVGWLLAGAGSHSSGLTHPALALWLPRYSPSPFDLGGSIPGSFDLGQFQFIGWAPLFGTESILLAGQGFYNRTTGTSLGALAEVQLTAPTGM